MGVRRAGRVVSAAMVAVLATAVPAHAAGPPEGTPKPPPGANVPCVPDAAHPHPVVLVHGTFGNAHDDWFAISPVLKRAGYCVYALDYGQTGHGRLHATGPIPASAAQLGRFVDGVLAETGASKVLLVGYSQGGSMPRHWMRHLGGRDRVAGLVAIAPTSHGTDSPIWRRLLGPIAPYCQACRDQYHDSAFMRELNAPYPTGDLEDGVAYTVVASRADLIVTPWRSQFLHGPNEARQVTNALLQDRCPHDGNGHVVSVVDPAVTEMVVNALDRGGRLDPAFRPTCRATPVKDFAERVRAVLAIAAEAPGALLTEFGAVLSGMLGGDHRDRSAG